MRASKRGCGKIGESVKGRVKNLTGEVGVEEGLLTSRSSKLGEGFGARRLAQGGGGGEGELSADKESSGSVAAQGEALFEIGGGPEQRHKVGL